MEKLNNGCEYCGSGKYLKEGFYILKMDDGSYVVDVDELCSDFEIYYCLACGRNLKTGNPMIEIKPLEFKSWEEFKNEEYFKFCTDNYKIELEITYGWIRITENGDIREIYKVIEEGYNQACEEIERIRREFIMELAEGNYDGN